jgi:uncharacterized protein YegL
MTDNNYTHLALVVDRSGSMSTIAKDMNGGIRQLLADQAKEPGVCVVDITTFDTEIEHPYENVRPDDVKSDIIVPRGGTALNDAVGYTINELGERFSKMEEGDRPGLVIVVVVTDGEENSSREYTHDQIKELVERQTNEWGWQFVYLAANVDAFATGGSYGFAKGSTIAYAASGAGTQNVYAATSSNVSGLRANMSRGVRGATIEFSDEDREEAMEQ